MLGQYSSLCSMHTVAIFPQINNNQDSQCGQNRHHVITMVLHYWFTDLVRR